MSEITQEEIEEIDNFINNLKEKRYRDSLNRTSKYSYSKQEIVLSEFDPNLADSITLRKLGIPAFVASNIIKYRKSGGKFKDASSLSKIYGLDASLFATLEPYISISSQFLVKRDTLRVASKDSLKVYKFQELTQVDLNSADTTTLKMIPGIGSGLAKMIVAYRKRLGGYFSVEQLDEIGYIDRNVYEWFTISTPIEEDSKIKVNSFSLDKLRNHPYMNFYKAKVIVEYRRKRGKIKNLSQLSFFEEFTEKDLDKLVYYLCFD